MGTIRDNIHVAGHLSADTMTIAAAAVTNASVSGTADIVRSKLAQDSNKVYPIDLTKLRVWDAFWTNLPGTAASDDLGLEGGTFATAPPMIKTSDLKAAGATTQFGRFQLILPAEYEDGETVTLRFSAGMETTVSDTTATIDVQAYESDRIGGISADLVTTGATTINSLTFADKDFAITASGLVAGEVLDCRVAIAINDAATGTAVVGSIGAVELVCDVRG